MTTNRPHACRSVLTAKFHGVSAALAESVPVRATRTQRLRDCGPNVQCSRRNTHVAAVFDDRTQAERATALGATGGAVAAGAIVGRTSGALAGAFSTAGYSKEETEYFGSTVERGGVLVAVESDDVSTERLRSELVQLGGRTYGTSQTAGRAETRPNL